MQKQNMIFYKFTCNFNYRIYFFKILNHYLSLSIKPSFSSRPTQASRCCTYTSYQLVSFLPGHPFSTLVLLTEHLRSEEINPIAVCSQVPWRVVYLFLSICEGMPHCELSLFSDRVEDDRTPSALSGEVP